MHPWQNKNLLWFARRYTSGEVVRLIWIALSFKGIASRDSGGGGGRIFSLSMIKSLILTTNVSVQVKKYVHLIQTVPFF